ncbi:MAG: CHAT domain-containing protein [Krumholzibacteria bacterium]|nr:CHAT domain-containing protein [Candidatus Krumholzibacteria bacterium]
MHLGTSPKTLVLLCALAAGLFRPAVADDARDAATADFAGLRRNQDYIAAYVMAVDAAAAGTADPRRLVADLNRIAGLAYECGDHFAATLAVDAAVAAARAGGGDDRHLGEALLWRALLRRRLLSAGDARADLQAADSLLATAQADPRVRGRLKQAHANFIRAETGSAASVPLYEDALAYRRANLPAPDPDTADNLVWLAWNLYEAGRFGEAMQRLAEAEAELRALGMERHTLMGTICELRFDQAALAGDLAACRETALQEIRIQQAARPGFPFGYARSAACSPLGYRRLLWVQLQEGRWEDAFVTWGQSQSPVTREFYRLRRWLEAHPAARADLRRIYGRIRIALAELDAAPPDAPPQAASLAALQAWADLQETLRGLDLPTEGPEVPAAAVQDHLEAGSALVGTVSFELGGSNPERLTVRRQDRWLVVVRPDTGLRWILGESATGDTLAALLREDVALRRTLQRAAAWPTAVAADPELERRLRRQATRILGPAVPHLQGVTTVVSIGLSQMVRMEFCPGAPAAVATVPALEIFADLAARPALAEEDRDVLLVDGGRPGPGLRALDTSGELALLKQLYPAARTLGGAAATEAVLEQWDAAGRLGRLGLAHFGGHIRNATVPERDALVVSGREEDGPGGDLVEAGELLYFYDLRPDLAVLAGCSSAHGRPRTWNEYSSLAQVLLSSGARHVVASRWDVDDRATALFMDRFYRALDTAGTADAPGACAAALAEAARWLREVRDADGRQPYAHPIYWAGFVLYGLP